MVYFGSHFPIFSMKKWYKSRQLWLNFLAAVALFSQSQFGFVVSPEMQGYLLVILNALLRLDTTEGLSL